MNEKLQVAKAKLLKAAQLINQANGILIREQGGDKLTHDAEELVLRAASGIGSGPVAVIEEAE